MANVVDQDQQWLLNCLSATLDPNPEVRCFAEASLDQASRQPGVLLADGDGFRKLSLFDNAVLFCVTKRMRAVVFGFGSALSKVAANKELAVGLPAVLLKQLVKKRWEEGEETFEPPVVSSDEKEIIRRMLLLALDDPHRKICTAIGMAVASIAVHDWPELEYQNGVYEKASIEGTEDSYDGRYDSDGSEKNLDSFVIQLFELMLTIVGNPRLGKVVVANVSELVYYTIAFLQMTEQQSYASIKDYGVDEVPITMDLPKYVHTWSVDANQFIADEEDATYSCRISEVVNSFDGEGMLAIIDATKRWFNESQIRKAAGNASWWRGTFENFHVCVYPDISVFETCGVGFVLRETTQIMKVVGTLGCDRWNLTGDNEWDQTHSTKFKQLFETQETRIDTRDLKHLVEQIFAEDSLIGPLEYPFLYARIFTSVAKFSSLISNVLLEQFLYLAMKAITMDVPPPVKVGACRALSNLIPETTNEIVQSQLLGLYSSLTDLLNHASDETLHMVLDTLLAAVKAGRESSTIVENMISPVILNLWASHVSDPFISIDALEILEAIKSIPGCIHPLVSRILPFIGPILNKNAAADVVKAIYDVSFNAVIKIILQSDDHSEIQNATECLSAFISSGRQEILAWGSDSVSTMRSLLDIASRLLDPKLESSGSLFVGSYILQLILHLPSQMAVHIRDLVAALVKRMQSSENAVLRSSLLIVFARLVHMSVPNVGQFIDLLISIPAEGHANSFAYVMSEWTKQQGDVQGAYQIKVTTSALALLITSRHNELEKIHVQGHLIKSGVGITTRSKSKSAPDQWVILPLPTKKISILGKQNRVVGEIHCTEIITLDQQSVIVASLADALTEIQEQVLVADDVDSDWEEVRADGNENDRGFLYSMSSSSGKATDEHLEAMAKVFNEDRDDQYEDDLLSVADPLNQINLANYLVDFFVSFSQSDRQLLDHICESLTRSQRNVIQMILKG
ncbi:unnamed protein product [Sphenostylis stenocarpa]|uniref:Importin N-terminal domain-containing protein n=1 Tax=Sphenostylis stenocarpa TaxID=92480 RepID=A0AA86RW36_9FABA|nr:unnamed protein product [Sphenostylis stenocarpa]